MDPLSLSPTDEGGASQDILQRRRERERNCREQETAEQREEPQYILCCPYSTVVSLRTSFMTFNDMHVIVYVYV